MTGSGSNPGDTNWFHRDTGKVVSSIPVSVPGMNSNFLDRWVSSATRERDIEYTIG